MINNIAIGLALALILFGVIGMAFSGVKNVINGKSEIKKVGVMLIPVIIFGVSYAALGTFNQAGVTTMLIMMLAMALGIVVTGTRGTFKF